LNLTLEYLLSVFIAALAVIQLGAVRAGLRGLYLGGSRLVACLVAVPCLLISGILFFTWNDRNPTGVIEGAQQAGLFSLAVAAAAAFTVILGLITNRRMPADRPTSTEGLEALKRTTFIHAIRSRFWKS
jgi:hypothetical protein